MKREGFLFLTAILVMTGCQRGNRYGFVDIASSERTLSILTEGFSSIPDSCKADRSTFLLGQGVRVTDVLQYGGDSLFPVPHGFASDSLSGETFMEDLHVKHNRLYTGDGRNYRILLVGKDTLSLAELQRLSELSAAGVFIGGKRPAAPSDPADSAIFFRTVERIGLSGNVMPGRTPRSMLKAADVLQDVKTRVDSIRYEHRHLPDAEIYRIRYDGSIPVRAKLKFRVSGRQPSVWNPDSGTILPVTYKIRKKKTKVVLYLVPGDDLFLVFCPYSDHHRMRLP